MLRHPTQPFVDVASLRRQTLRERYENRLTRIPPTHRQIRRSTSPLITHNILPPIQPHQPKRNLNKLRQLITLPRLDLYSHPIAPVTASNTWRQHSPQPNPNPAESQYSPNTTYPASLPQSAQHWPLLRHKPLRS
jgi:hypothetical protein